MSTLQARLSAAMGKNINQICDGLFHAASDNHCAHFVSHILDLRFSFNCKQFKGGNGSPANVRVNEVFAQCPLVGHWANADTTRDQIVFVTRKDNVNVSTKFMGNIPQKHIGVYHNGLVHHYSNGNDQVVAWTPDVFLATFQNVYSGDQGLYFGTFPGGDLEFAVQGSSASVARGIGFDLVKTGTEWHATANQPGAAKFNVGRETSNGSYIGLFMRVNEYYGPKYQAASYVAHYDHWAQLLELTGHCESKNFFNLINTYDSAKFTFGFYQLAAHTAGDNLILLFHGLLAMPEFVSYFPEVQKINGRLHRVDENGSTTDLEVETPTGPSGRRQLQAFMDFLNAKRLEHDMQEVLQSARMIHWANTHPSMQGVQVAVAASILQRKMSQNYAQWYDLDGKSDIICAVIADIHHQGRAKKSAVRAALASGDVLNRLIDISPDYLQRNADLRTKLGEMTASGQLGTRIYHAGLNEFQ